MIIYMSFKELLHLIINATFILQVSFYPYRSIGDMHLVNIWISTAVLVLNWSSFLRIYESHVSGGFYFVLVVEKSY
jgi:hypothetical protein